MLTTPVSGHYQFEYMKIHDQRMLLNTAINTYYTGSVAFSAVLFGAFVGFGNEDGCIRWQFVSLGFLAAVVVLVLGQWYVQKIDVAIFKLYPRIVALELMLDFRFWRQYLNDLGTPYRSFVADCEEYVTKVQNPTELWDQIARRAETFRYTQAGRLVAPRRGGTIVIGVLYLIVWLGLLLLSGVC